MARGPADDTAGVLVVVTTLVASPEEGRWLESLLAADERSRAERMVAGVRERFVVGRARLRQLLGRLLGASPGKLEFRYGRWGKPELAAWSTRPLHFNLSHSGNKGLIAVSRELPVGIDLELHTATFTPKWSARMAASILTDAELTAWRTLPEPDRPRSLLETWVAKEAVFKAIGCGLAGGLRRLSLLSDGRRLPDPVAQASPIQVSVSPDGDQPATILTARLLHIGGNAHAALATIGGPVQVTMSSFEAFMGCDPDPAPGT